jgi:hypothetical protein
MRWSTAGACVAFDPRRRRVVLVHELGHAAVARRRLCSEVRVVVGDTGQLGELRVLG